MRPNILLITCDQLRADALACYGNDVVRTPHIDRLAAAGTRFNRMHVAAPVCAPNRGSIATGRWPAVHGLRANGYVLPASELTLMECLRRSGYATFGAGKMHFGPQWKFGPGEIEALLREGAHGRGAIDPQPKPWEFPFHGFEQGMFSEDNREGPFADYLRARGLDPWADPHSFTYPQHITARSTWPEEHHQTTWVADRAIEFMESARQDRPFFLWASFVHPHHPFNPPAPFDSMYDPARMPAPLWAPGESARWPQALKAKYEARTGSHEAIGMCDLTDDDFRRVKSYYYGMVSLIDKQVGRLVERMPRRADGAPTLVVFTSDHGELLGDHRLLFKGAHYGCVTRVPFVIAGLRAGGQVADTLCQSTDIMPTLLDAVGLPVPETVQGCSLLPAVRKSDVQLQTEAFVENGPGGPCSVVTGRGRLTWHGPGERGELYDLTADPHEFCNLWNEPSVAELQRELLDRLLVRLRENNDPRHRRLALC